VILNNEQYFIKGIAMNIKQSFSVIQSAVLIMSLIILSGCTSTTDSAQKSTSSTAETNHETYVQITQQELQQLQTSSAQWQAIKPDLERLLLIESDLNLLIAQLTAIANDDENTGNNSHSSAALASQQVPLDRPAQSIATQSNITNNALFALQIIAVTQQSQLAPSWQTIQQKVPSLLSDKFTTNVETAQVKGMTYYRLKIGAYQYQKNAQADCDKLKLQQLNCMVTHYTDNPIKL
jgi:hypothetical protein